MGRDTVRLGLKLRGTLGAWLDAWHASVVWMVVLGVVGDGDLHPLSPQRTRHARTSRAGRSRSSPLVGLGRSR